MYILGKNFFTQITSISTRFKWKFIFLQKMKGKDNFSFSLNDISLYLKQKKLGFTTGRCLILFALARMYVCSPDSPKLGFRCIRRLELGILSRTAECILSYITSWPANLKEVNQLLHHPVLEYWQVFPIKPP